MEAALAQGVYATSSTLPPTPESMASDDRHPLILLVSAVFWVFRTFLFLLVKRTANLDCGSSVAAIMGESIGSVCYNHNPEAHIFHFVVFNDLDCMFIAYFLMLRLNLVYCSLTSGRSLSCSPAL